MDLEALHLRRRARHRLLQSESVVSVSMSIEYHVIRDYAAPRPRLICLLSSPVPNSQSCRTKVLAIDTEEKEVWPDMGMGERDA